MSPERHPSHDDVDSGGGGGGSAIIGGHVTVETSSPVPSPGPDLKDHPSSTSFATSIGSSMVLSSIPLEANHQLILQQHLAQQHHIIATSGNTNQNSNSNGSAISSATNGGVGNHSIIINNNTSFKNHNSNSNNIIISGSGLGGGNGNNHTYTINLSSSGGGGGSVASHNGHAMIQSYATPAGSVAAGGHHGHHHHQQQQHQQFYSAPNNVVVSSGAGSHGNVAAATVSSTAATVVAPPATSTSSSSSTSSASKLVVLQQGHLGENYITTTESMNGVGNIVLLATEQMDMSSAEHDFINNNVVITTSSGSSSSVASHLNSGSTNHHPAHHNHQQHHHSQQQQSLQQHIRNGTVLTAVHGAGGTSQVVINTDEELTPLTWLHDKNLLKGINLSKVPVSSPDSPRQAGGGHLSPTSDFVEDSSVSEDNTSSANSSSDQSIGVFCTETIPSSARHLTVGTGPTHHRFQLTNGTGGQQTITTINGNTIIEYPVISSDDKDLKSPSSTASCASSTSSTSSLYNHSATSPNPTSGSVQNGSTSGASTPHQHFHKKYLREEHVKQLKQVSSSYVTPVKQLSSAVKYEEGEIIEERPYPPAAPMKNGYPSPNVSSDEYGSTYGSGGGSMRPPSPPLSPQHHLVQGQSLNGGGIHVLPQHPPSSPQPQQPSSKLSPPKAKHPTNVPYDPLVHISSKPPFSFSSLIFMAIENAQQKALPVKEIYAWIVQHFPYFKTAPTGWKNSVRHNLSLNKCFQKVEKAANLGKGSLWMVEPQYRPNLIQALSRSPFHSGSGIDKTTYKAMQQQAQQQAQQQQRSTDSPTSSVGSSYSKDNFPYLASRLAPVDAQNGVHLPHHMNGGQQQHPSDLDGDDFSRSSTPIDYDGDLPHQHLHHHHLQSSASGGLPYHVAYHHPPPPSSSGPLGPPSGGSNGFLPGTGGGGGSVILPNGQSVPAGDIIGRDWSADTIDDVNAATAMLALKHGPKIFTEGFQNGTPPVITTSPSEDHTYSAGGTIPPSGLSERSSQNNSDNNSNGTSSDAAYESSEESHNLVIEDQEEQRRLAGVDALLNLAGITNYAPMSGSTGNTGLKRPAEPTASYDEPVAALYGQRSPYHQPASHHQLEVTPPSGYGGGQHQATIRSYSYGLADDLSLQYSPSPSPSKKSKSSSSSSSAATASASVRMLKKFKKKASWVR